MHDFCCQMSNESMLVYMCSDLQVELFGVPALQVFIMPQLMASYLIS